MGILDAGHVPPDEVRRQPADVQGDAAADADDVIAAARPLVLAEAGEAPDEVQGLLVLRGVELVVDGADAVPREVGAQRRAVQRGHVAVDEAEHPRIAVVLGERRVLGIEQPVDGDDVVGDALGAPQPKRGIAARILGAEHAVGELRVVRCVVRCHRHLLFKAKSTTKDRLSDGDLDHDQAQLLGAGIREGVRPTRAVDDERAWADVELDALQRHPPSARDDDVHLLIVVPVRVAADVGARRYADEVDEVVRGAALAGQVAAERDFGGAAVGEAAGVGHRFRSRRPISGARSRFVSSKQSPFRRWA